MASKRDHNAKIRDFIARFEAGLDANAPVYFDQDAYQQIVEHYLENGNNQRASQACDLGMEMHPYSADLLILYGKLAFNRGDHKVAVDYLNRGLALQPFHSDGILLLTMCSLKDELISSAQTIIEQALIVNPEDELLLLAQGLIYKHKGKLGSAISTLTQVIKIDDTNDQAWHTLTELVVRYDKADVVLPFYKERIDANPYNYHAWFYIGQLYNQNSDFAAAADAFDYCTVIDEEMADGWFMKGAALMNLKLYQDAMQCLNHVLTLVDDHPDAKLYIAACYEQTKEYDKAIQAYKRLINQDKENADAWYGVGSCMLAQDRSFEAIHWFNKAIDILPEKGMYWYGLAQAEYRMGNLISADEAFENAVNYEPFAPELYLDWSFIYYESGDFDKAFDILSSAIDNKPDDASLYYRAVVYLLSQGSYRQALVYLEKALFLDFDGHTVLFDFFDELATQKALFKIIDQYKPKHQ